MPDKEYIIGESRYIRTEKKCAAPAFKQQTQFTISTPKYSGTPGGDMHIQMSKRRTYTYNEK